jgi:hypothetical protein
VGPCCWLQDAIEDLHVPMMDLKKSMTLQQQQSAGSLTKLIVMIHTHNRLLRKYGNELCGVVMFHTCCDRDMYKEFRWVAVLRQCCSSAG